MTKFATNSRARLRGARDENRPQLKEKTKRRARVGAPGELPDFQKLRKIGTGKVRAKEATKAQGFQLRTSKRAESRAAFDKALDARRKIKEEERLERERIEKEKEVEERKALVHKPTAIRGRTPPPEIQRSDKTFTQPESPQFRTSARLRARKEKKNAVSDMEEY